MPKGYWVARVDVYDQGRLQELRRHERRGPSPNTAGVFFHRGAAGRFSSASSASSRSRNVVIEFPSYEDALACWNSRGITRRHAQRQEGGAEMDAIVIEGYEGPQPG